tara:strand:+ start:1754 stop:3010 length:1257 start_codon:yes stop_codon:yes gene_type:complete
MPEKPEAQISSQQGRRSSALIAVPLICAGYWWYLVSGSDVELYEYSKSLASYDYRQHLGLSKRFLLQYGHMVFLFSLLVCTKYIFTGNRFSQRQSAMITTAAAYTVPVFIFHFLFLYFIAAITRHDPASDFSQSLLLGLTVTASLTAGKACLLMKPRFDMIKRRYLDHINQRDNPSDPGSGPAVRDDAMMMAQTQSDVMNIVKILAMAAIFLGHFSFDVFSSWKMPGFDGNAPRFAVPAFFMISGYLAMLSVDRTVGNITKVIVKRYWSLIYLVAPMLLLTPVLDAVGFSLDPGLYDRVVYFDIEKGRLPALLSGIDALWRVPFTWVTSLLYLNEIWLFNLAGLNPLLGGVHSFSNEAFWFLCYLMPFQFILIIVRLASGWQRWISLIMVVALCGPPLLLLAPLFFSGSLAYIIHKHW